jgi:hypothetical protein
MVLIIFSARSIVSLDCIYLTSSFFIRIPLSVSSIVTCEGLSMLYFLANSIGIITVDDSPLLRNIGAIFF